MTPNDFYACFGGFGIQHWGNIYAPDIAGNCHALTVCVVDGETGAMQPVQQGPEVLSPSTLVVSPDQKYIYAGSEEKDFMGQSYGGGLNAFAFDMETGSLRLINQSLAYGSSTAYTTLDKTGQYIFVANHGSKFSVSRYEMENGALQPKVLRDEGCVCVFKVREDGGIGPLVDRLVLEGTGAHPIEHASAHPHSILLDEQDFAVIPNKGGDNIYVCRFDRAAEKLKVLSVYKSEFGSSPRHACFVPGTPYVLVQNEYDAHLCSYSLDRETGTLTRISRLDTYVPELEGPKFHLMEKMKQTRPWGCDVQLHPNGRFAFTNNSQGVLSTFEVNRETGELTLLHRYALTESGSMTRGMQIDRSGRFLVATGVMDEKAMIFAIDPETGELTHTSDVALPTPTALRFLYPQQA